MGEYRLFPALTGKKTDFTVTEKGKKMIPLRQIFTSDQAKLFKVVAVNSFNPCYLVSLLILSLFSRQIAVLFAPDYYVYFYVLLPFVNGALSCIVIALFFGLIRHRMAPSRYQNKNQVLVVSFFTGLLTIYAAGSQLVSFGIFLAVMYVTLINLRDFMRKLWVYLAPDKILTKEDMFNFSSFFISLITAFIVLNLTVSFLHDFFGAGQAFNFKPGIEGILDAVYFTFICITTVGFGDIVPLTPFAKIIVSFECVSSYIMLALFIGVVNRGITKAKQ